MEQCALSSLGQPNPQLNELYNIHDTQPVILRNVSPPNITQVVTMYGRGSKVFFFFYITL
jgi:hypothetical protein